MSKTNLDLFLALKYYATHWKIWKHEQEKQYSEKRKELKKYLKDLIREKQLIIYKKDNLMSYKVAGFLFIEEIPRKISDLLC